MIGLDYKHHYLKVKLKMKMKYPCSVTHLSTPQLMFKFQILW